MMVAATSANAASLDFGDILGNWCGSRSNPHWTNYQISRTTLTVTHLPSGSKTTLQIDHFDFTEMYQSNRPSVVIYYLAAGHGGQAGTPGHTLIHAGFINFSSDGRSMTQVKSDVTNEYHFTRCR